MYETNLSAADVAAVTRNNDGGMFGNDAWWIIILLLFGYGRGFGGGFGGGAMDNYVLTSDFSQLSRQISDGFAGVERRTDSIINGLCDGFYTQAQLVNGVNTNIMQGQFALSKDVHDVQDAVKDCCCKTQASFADTNYNIATQANTLGRSIENGFAQTNFNMATQNCQTLQEINKVGDKIIDFMSNEKLLALRDENQALRLAASQAKQNQYLIDQLGYHCPQPAYVVQPPQNVTFPTNCCGGVNYAGFNCGCNG